MSNAHTIKFGCGCRLCMEPKKFVEFPGVEECERRQSVYESKRRLACEANGRLVVRMVGKR